MGTGGTRRPGHLLRVLGLAFGIAVGVGTMIGGGILRTPGEVAARVGEPWLILALWTLGGVHALLGANVVAEIGTSVPKAGGLYVPTRRAFGDFAGLLVGWSDWLVNAAAAAALALIFGEFCAILSPGLAPVAPALSAGIVLLLAGLNALGVREGSAVQKAGSFAKCLLLLATVAILLLLVPDAAEGPAPVAAPVLTLAGAVVAYQLVYAVFSGWIVPILFVEEDRDAGRNIPRAMLVSILTVTFIYLAINAALLHALPVRRLAGTELPVAAAMAAIFGGDSIRIVAAIAVVIVASCLNAVIMVLPRILYGLGRDGLFLPAATAVNRGGTPHVALAFSAAVALLMTLTGTFETVFLLMGGLIFFTMIVSELSLFALRLREPDLPRPYRAKLYPVLPALLLLVDTALLGAVIWARPVSGLYMIALIALALPVHGWIRWKRRPG